MLGIHTILVVEECGLLLGLLDYCQTYIYMHILESEREGERERGKEEGREAGENEYCWWVPNIVHAVMHNIIIFYLEHRNKHIACLKQVVSFTGEH